MQNKKLDQIKFILETFIKIRKKKKLRIISLNQFGLLMKQYKITWIDTAYVLENIRISM